MRTPHTQTHRGKAVRVVLRDGTVLVDKFDYRTHRFVFLLKAGRIPKCEIKSFTIFKAQVLGPPPSSKTGDDNTATK